MEIEFQGQYDKNLFYKAVALANMPSRRGNIIRILSLVIIAVVFVWLVASYLTQNNPNTFKALRLSITIPMLAYFLLSPYITSWRVASQLWKDKTIQALVTGRVTGLGITYTSSTAEKEFKWESFARVRKAQDLIVLVTADGTISIHPRSFFGNDGDWGRFQQLVEFKVVEAK